MQSLQILLSFIIIQRKICEKDMKENACAQGGGLGY